MAFIQQGPRLPHPLHHDRVLGVWLRIHFEPDELAGFQPHLENLGDYAIAAYTRSVPGRGEEPELTHWDAWGRRIDHITLGTAWREGAALTARHGLLWAGHEPHPSGLQRCSQFARVYLYHVASAFYTCPLAMTDGAATVLKANPELPLAARLLPRFLSRSAESLWLAGQWMTETSGGSDVSGTEVEARQDGAGRWRLYGRKWFASAIVGDAALALARPAGAGPGSSALGLFLAQTRTDEGSWCDGLRIERLKDKLGTRELPTAEITLDGLEAVPIGEPSQGVRKIAPVLNITRTWNTICALATMRRALALAHDYAMRRAAFGGILADKPLHRETLAGLAAEFEAAFALGFGVARLLGIVESGLADAADHAAWRVLTPLAKLWTGKLAVCIASECLEAFGGAGYIEDTGLPLLLRNAQVYPIWEGTTNVLALDALRVLEHGPAPLTSWLRSQWPRRNPEGMAVLAALDAATRWWQQVQTDAPRLQAGARGLALTLARCAAATFLAKTAQSAGEIGDPRPAAALRRFLANGVLRLPPLAADESSAVLSQD